MTKTKTPSGTQLDFGVLHRRAVSDRKLTYHEWPYFAHTVHEYTITCHALTLPSNNASTSYIAP